MTDIATATCPACDREVPADELAAGTCAACRTVDEAASVRPPDHLADQPEPQATPERDPLDGWDQPGADVQVSLPPPPTWALLAGAAGFAGVVGLATGLGSGASGLRRGMAWALAGAATAGAVLRVWELEPESSEWARTASDAGNARPRVEV